MLYYKYIFYQTYKFFLKFSRNYIPDGKAFLLFSGFILYNIITITFMLPKFNGNQLYPKSLICIIFVVVLFYNYKLFMKNNQYDKIKSYFDNQEYPKSFNLILAKFLIWLFYLYPFISAALFTYFVRNYQ
jgi:hypothetical protein